MQLPPIHWWGLVLGLIQHFIPSNICQIYWLFPDDFTAVNNKQPKLHKKRLLRLHPDADADTYAVHNVVIIIATEDDEQYW